MKTLVTIGLLFLATLSQAQVVEATENEDGSYKYMFSLNEFQKPLNYPIEIAHLGGNINQLKGNIGKSNYKGTITFKDIDGTILFQKNIENDLAFEFNTDKKKVIVECEVDGFVSYTKTISVDVLNILVIRMQNQPNDNYYMVNAESMLQDIELKLIMQCVYDFEKGNSMKTDINECGMRKSKITLL